MGLYNSVIDLENSIWWLSMPRIYDHHRQRSHNRLGTTKKKKKKKGKQILTIDGVEVFLGLIVQSPGLLFELLESSFCITVHSVLGVLANIELGPD